MLGVGSGDGDGVGKNDVTAGSAAGSLESGGTGAVSGLGSAAGDGADRGVTGAVGAVSSNESPPLALALAAEALKSAAAPATLSSAFAKS